MMWLYAYSKRYQKELLFGSHLPLYARAKYKCKLHTRFFMYTVAHALLFV
jgi:hypothetical protein